MVAITAFPVPVIRPARRRLVVVPRPHTVPDVPTTVAVPVDAGAAIRTSPLVVVLVLLAAAVVLLLALGRPVAGEPGAGVPTAGDHTVVAGETMWSIATDVAPAGEAAAYVERLVDANGTSVVSPGQVLVLPVP